MVQKSGKFDVTMGAPDGAETCELVGLMLLEKNKSLFPELNFGLYRDDGLATHSHIPGPKLDKIRKDLHKLFNEHGLKVTIDTNLHCVNFLDVTLDLKKESHGPYRKPNDTTLYIHRDSNHPPLVIKEVPKIINDRLNNISSNEKLFNKATAEYQKALDTSGYNYRLKYKKQEREKDANSSAGEKQAKKKRNILYFTPPFNKNVKTNTGETLF